MEPNPVRIPTKAMTLWQSRDLVVNEAESFAEPEAKPSLGRHSHTTETESGHEESGQWL
jgi:hypothetical protein